MKPVVVITGGTSGIGRALAIEYYTNKYEVYTISRSDYNWKDLSINHITCDVTNTNDLKRAFQFVESREESISQLICSAGFGISGVTEYTTLTEAKSQFDVNFFGLFSTIKNFLPLIKKAKNGKIIFISSVAAEISIPFQSFYSASKAASNKLLEAWQLELKRFGIQTSLFLLGDIKTEFTSHRRKSTAEGTEYGESLRRSIERMERDERNGISPEYVAKRVYLSSKKKRLKSIQTIGFNYHIFLMLQRLLPRKLVLFLVGNMYAK